MLKLLNQFSGRALKYGVAAIILAVPLYPKFPFIRVPGTYVSIRLEDFILGAVGLLWFISTLPQLKQFLTNKINRSILLFFAVGLLSVASGILLTQTVVPHIGILHWLRRVEYLLCFFIGFSAVRDKKDLVFYIKCLVIVVFFAFIYGFGQKNFTWPVITTQNYEYAKGVALRFMPGGHLVSTFAGHYDLASFLVLVMPLLIVLVTAKKSLLKNLSLENPNKFFRIVLILAILSGLWLLANTASRISVASYLISAVLALMLLRKFLYIPIIVIVSLVFMSTSSNLMDRYIRVFEVYIQRVIKVERQVLNFPPAVYAQERHDSSNVPTPEPAPVFEDRSTSIRLNVEWPRAIRALQKNPLLGTGYSSITLATDNDYLRILGETGILGFLSFFLIFFKVGLVFLKKLKLLFKQSIESAFIMSMIAALPGIFINALFIDVFEASKFAIIFWLMLGFTVKLTLQLEEQNK